MIKPQIIDFMETHREGCMLFQAESYMMTKAIYKQMHPSEEDIQRAHNDYQALSDSLAKK